MPLLRTHAGAVRVRRGIKPPVHACSPRARSLLRAVAFGRRWAWRLQTGEEPLVSYCPWCGEALPHEREVQLELIRGFRDDQKK